MAKRIAFLTVLLVSSFAFTSLSQSIYELSNLLMHTHLPKVKIDKVDYVCLDEVVRVLRMHQEIGGKIYQDEKEGKAIWYYKGQRLEFTPFSPYVLIDNSIYDLLFEVKLKKGEIFVPQKNFFSLLKEIKKQSKKFKENLSLDAYAFSKPSYLEYNITDIFASKKLNGILIEIFISYPINYEVFKSENNCINIFFYEGKIDTGYFNFKEIPGIIKKIRAYQYGNSVQVSLWTRKPFHTLSHNLESFPFRIQISLEDTTEIAKSAQDDLIDVVVIDPGHGGVDFGFFGQRSLWEKDITLDIALRLKKLLEKETDLKVVLTRDYDVFILLKKRARIANKEGGDLLISIHCEFSEDENESGFKIFFFGESQKDKETTLTFKEDLEKTNEIFSDSIFILLDTTRYLFFEQSKNLAFIVCEEMGKKLKMFSKGIFQEKFLVLKKAYMPGVLVNCGFISNPDEEKLLAQSPFREKIAEALFFGIMRFKIEGEHEKGYEAKR